MGPVAGRHQGRVPDRDPDFDVWPGEVLGVLGPNGAGKTALFNLVSGDVSLDKDEPPFKRCRRCIGRTCQIPKPYVGMTAFEDLLVAAIFGGGQLERASYAHCAAILDDCGLCDKADHLAGKRTLLDRKRLELARAVASAPQLLLDEIAGGLTDEESHQFVELVKRIKARQIRVVWIEHVLNALMAVADRLMVLNFGQKIAEGAPQQVMQNVEVQRVYMGIEV